MSRAQRIIAIVVAAYLLLVLFDRFVLVELLLRRVGVSLLLAAFEAVAIIGVGFAARGLFARAWRNPDGNVGEIDFARELLIGYPIFGTLCFLLGTLDVSSWSMGALLVLCGLGGIYAIVRRLETRPLAAPPAVDPLALLAIVAVLAAAFIAAQAPPTSLDELAYHLAVPWTWVKEHRAIALPLISHSYFPLGVESADLPLLSILGRDGALASHFLHLGAAIATTVMLFRLARGNALATAAVVTTPALALTAGWSLVDWPLAGVCVALVVALADDDGATISAAIAAGLLTKYTFIPFAIIALAVARRWRGVLPGIALGSIFFLRNLAIAGNPIAPFLGAASPHVAGYRGQPFLSDYAFDGRFIDESLGASLLMSCAMSAGALSWILLAAGLLLFLLGPSARILLPFFIVPAARAMQPGRVLRVLLLVAVAAQLFLIAFFVDRTEAFSLLSGRSSDQQYLTKQRASYATIVAIDALLPPDSRTLVIGLNETFWFARRVRGGGNFDGERVSQYLEAPTPEALYARLKNDGITHVAVVSPPAPNTAVEAKIEERQTALSANAQRTLAQTLDHYASYVTSRDRAIVFLLR